MVNKPRAKGTAHETSTVRYLIERGFAYAHRNPLSSALGDVGGIPGFIIECKNHARLALSEWITQAEASAAKAEALPIVVIKRRGKPIQDAYVLTTLKAWCDDQLRRS